MAVYSPGASAVTEDGQRRSGPSLTGRDFPLIRITDTKVNTYPPGPVRGAHGVPVHDDVPVFIGGYGKPYQVTEC